MSTNEKNLVMIAVGLFSVAYGFFLWGSHVGTKTTTALARQVIGQSTQEVYACIGNAEVKTTDGFEVVPGKAVTDCFNHTYSVPTPTPSLVQ